MNFIVQIVSMFLAELAKLIHTTPKTIGGFTHGEMELKPTPIEEVINRAKKNGLLILLIVLSLSSCAQTKVVVSTMYPVDDTTKGWPRIAQDEVQVIINGSNEIGTLSPAGGYFLIHEKDLKALIKAAAETRR